MENLDKFIQLNSPDGGFLQSVFWRKFQESYGRKTFELSEKDKNSDTIIYAYAIVHTLPVVGNYFYVPRGPVMQVQNSKFKIQSFFENVINLAKRNNIGWIRIEPANNIILDLIKENLPGGVKIKKSAVDMQPREILVLDISKSEDEILSRMKQKTRYNIKLSQKRGVSVKAISNFQFPISKQCIEEFIELVKITSERDKITAHPEDYYRKMFEIIPGDILKLYVAEYEGKIIAANLVLFSGKTTTYMHGASNNEYRSVMAPYLLQWQQISDAKKAEYIKYDFGGVKTHNMEHKVWNKSWSGITKFKTGFAPNTKPIEFPGSYDIILNPIKYNFYRVIQKAKKIIR